LGRTVPIIVRPKRSELRDAYTGVGSMDNVPDAFLSYTRFDDDYHNGKISEFRTQLSKAVRAVTGTEFSIFQDVDSLSIGDRWHEEIMSSLSKCIFLYQS
jgi:hypothetical protein